MNHGLKIGLTVWAVWSLGASPGPAQRACDALVARCVAARIRSQDFTGVVSAQLPAGPISYARGRLNGPSSPAIDEETRFNIASAGKMFTAVAVAQLVDAGKIRLDDRIGRYLRGLSSATRTVTVRELLTHSAGLGNYFIPGNLPAIARARTAADLLPLVASDMPAFAPGSRFEYSNTGYLILGVLIERVSGQSYGQYLRDHIFRPSGMTASTLDPAPPSGRAVGMTALAAEPSSVVGAGPVRRQLPPSGETPTSEGPLRPAPEAALFGGPAGGAYSSIADLRRFFAALTAGELTSRTMFVALTSRQIVAAPATATAPERDYGLGFGLGVFEGHRWFGHNGGAPGVNTELAVFPDDKLALMVLANRDPPAATTLFRQVRELLFNPTRCQLK